MVNLPYCEFCYNRKDLTRNSPNFIEFPGKITDDASRDEQITENLNDNCIAAHPRGAHERRPLLFLEVKDS